MVISKAVTVGMGKELFNNRRLSTKLVEKFDQQSSTELSRAACWQCPFGAIAPQAGRQGLCMAPEWLFTAPLSDTYHHGLADGKR